MAKYLHPFGSVSSREVQYNFVIGLTSKRQRVDSKVVCLWPTMLCEACASLQRSEAFDSPGSNINNRQARAVRLRRIDESARREQRLAVVRPY